MNEKCRIETFLGDAECPAIRDKNDKFIRWVDCSECPYYLTKEEFITKKLQYNILSE